MVEFQHTSEKLPVVLNFEQIVLLASSKELGTAALDMMGWPHSVLKNGVSDLGVDEAAGTRRSAVGARVKQARLFTGMKMRIRKVKFYRK
eukprot:6958790-Pyramimonas_sp.AAC.1